MNPWGKVGVSPRNRSIEFRISLVRHMTRSLRVNVRRGVTHVRSSLSTHICQLSDLGFLLGILDSFCREHNLVASKAGAKAILQALLGLPVTLEDIPPQEHLLGDPVALHQTVIEADIIPTQGNVQVERD